MFFDYTHKVNGYRLKKLIESRQYSRYNYKDE